MTNDVILEHNGHTVKLGNIPSGGIFMFPGGDRVYMRLARDYPNDYFPIVNLRDGVVYEHNKEIMVVLVKGAVRLIPNG